MAAMGAFQRVWQGINIRGCLFHLCQAIFRKCGTLGLTNLLKEHNGFMRCIKETCCLAMHPPDQIIPVWNRVVKTKLLAKFLGLKTLRVEFVPLFKYVQKFWIKTVGPSRFSCFDDRVATTNALESYHG